MGSLTVAFDATHMTHKGEKCKEVRIFLTPLVSRALGEKFQ